MAKMSGMQMKAYAMAEKKESPKTKKAEMKSGMKMMKKAAPKKMAMKKMGKKK
jgi:hypothetical protein